MEIEKILNEISEIENEAKKMIKEITDEKGMEEWRVKFLGRKGKINSITSKLPQIPQELRPEIGKRINSLKKTLINLYNESIKKIKKEEKFENLSFPGKRPKIGTLHPLTLIIREMTDIFFKMGFGIVTGPEIENDYYNFEALNTPEYHPAKSFWDTFYLNEKEKILLRTHTSPVQIRVMERMKPPFKIIAVGRCYRRDALDASHSPVFHQMEGLMVGKDIKFPHLKGVLTYFLHQLFGSEIKIKFSPSYFPFTEPSAEVSISCIICNGKGCSTCGYTGYIEILGCGMVHPQVFRNVGYDPEKVTGFAFGMGVERIAMLKFKIDDIRYFYQNDIRFLNQFG
ncbi:MAG TPA: phenylalanine--tRNA ligase subunit alpha [Firmicutes bacterium]|nr:phenylalanine--tRNA ligase subunit alpha [Bacillota bacterium]